MIIQYYVKVGGNNVPLCFQHAVWAAAQKGKFVWSEAVETELKCRKHDSGQMVRTYPNGRENPPVMVPRVPDPLP